MKHIVELNVENYKRIRVVAIHPNGRVIMLTGKNGQGKQQPLTEPVLTPHGWKPIGSLSIGDDVIGSSGTPIKVTGVFPQTIRETYRVTLSDGAWTRCGPEHLWTVSRWGNNGERITETLSTNEIIKAGLRRGTSKKWAVPTVCAVEFADSGQELPINPYVLGVILGDGHIEPTGYTTITSDTAILDVIEPPDCWRTEHELGSGFWSRPLRHMGLAGKRAWEKFVPAPYLWASVEDRRALLAGLLDTDGTAMESWASFTSTSEALADSVVHLANSLGFGASKRGGVTKKYRYNGELKEGRLAWYITIKSKESPFTLARKAEAWSPSEQRAERWRFIDTIERIEDEDSVCIKVSAEDGLYVTRDFILTHNTSVLDALWFALKGQKALPDKKASIIRNGAERMKVRLNLGDCIVTRSLGREGNPPTLKVEMVNGKRTATPQDFLDDLFTSLTFDPLAFIQMTAKEQVLELRKTAKIDLDFDEIAAANEEDYKLRRRVKLEADELEAQMKGLNVLQGLPKDKLDEAAILAKLEQAGKANRKAQEIFQARQELGAAAARLGVDKVRKLDAIETQQKTIKLIEDELKAARARLDAMTKEYEQLEAERKKAEAAFQAAPAGELVDVAALTAELQSAQRTNRAIDVRAQYDVLQKKLDAKQREAEDLTRRMEAREEKKRTAVAKARIPVEGLTFDETEVKYNGIALENLGEGEQIRISTLIAMAGNPKLRVICIRHGEALDEDGLKVIADLAEQHDYQVWMARVDSSGKVGLVLEDGMIVARNEPLEGRDDA